MYVRVSAWMWICVCSSPEKKWVRRWKRTISHWTLELRFLLWDEYCSWKRQKQSPWPWRGGRLWWSVIKLSQSSAWRSLSPVCQNFFYSRARDSANHFLVDRSVTSSLKSIEYGVSSHRRSCRNARDCQTAILSNDETSSLTIYRSSVSLYTGQDNFTFLQPSLNQISVSADTKQ